MNVLSFPSCSRWSRNNKVKRPRLLGACSLPVTVTLICFLLIFPCEAFLPKYSPHWHKFPPIRMIIDCEKGHLLLPSSSLRPPFTSPLPLSPSPLPSHSSSSPLRERKSNVLSTIASAALSFSVWFTLIAGIGSTNLEESSQSASITTQRTLPTFQLRPAAAVAATDPSWTDRNRLVADAWRSVDELFYDRTFNGQDWFALRQKAVKQSFSSDESAYESIKKMLAPLGDQYTRYLPPSSYSVLVNSAMGELTGVGVGLALTDDGYVKITSLEDAGPAKNSGLQVGDIIIDVDGTKTEGLSAEEVAGILRGRMDTKASLRVMREGGKTMDFTIIRKPFKLTGVLASAVPVDIGKGGGKEGTAKGLKGQQLVGIITIKSFSSTTNADVTTALEDLHAKYDHLGAIVIDMRGNGGGLLQGAVETASLFMPPGKIVVFQVDSKGNVDAMMTLPNSVVSTDTQLPDLTTPLYCLVDKNTASAAEVLSATLKENGRATLVGEKTFGKGVIQTLQELRQGGIAVTIAKYETPLHNNINKVGIPVDIPISCGVNEPAADCVAKFL